jgi:glycine cleavage system aminomethyltransferase T
MRIGMDVRIDDVSSRSPPGAARPTSASCSSALVDAPLAELVLRLRKYAGRQSVPVMISRTSYTGDQG